MEARRWNGDLAALGEAVKATPQGGSGTTAHPFQTSIVLSLRTAAIGASGRGRLYWPATGLAMNSGTLRPAGSAVLAILSGFKTYLTSIGTAIDTVTTEVPFLSVWSRTNATTAPVINIQMGDILDTQRRRRDAAVETYQTVSYPT